MKACSALAKHQINNSANSKVHFLFFICLVISLLMPSLTHASLTFTPMRVVFEDRDRFADIILINTSNEVKTYELGWQHYKMQEDGLYAVSDASATDFDVSKHVVYSPRRVTLSPGGKQRVRLALRRPSNPISEGDHYTHLKFGEVAQPSISEDGDIIEQKPKAIVSINVGYSIPVVVRSGAYAETAEIESMEFTSMSDPSMIKAIIPVKRTSGAHGIMGHMFVYHVNGAGEAKLVGEMSNANIFPEIQRRIFGFPLKKEDIKGGNLKVVFKSFEKIKDQIYDQKTFPVP